jgi:hypothetical protein
MKICLKENLLLKDVIRVKKDPVETSDNFIKGIHIDIYSNWD